MDLIRLKRVHFERTINIGGVVAMAWEDGTHGWELYLDPASSRLVLKNGLMTFGVGPGQWVSCEHQTPAPETLSTSREAAAVMVEAAVASREAEQRIPIKAIRARQKKMMADRSEDK